MPLVCGIDEAGRGPLIGPMVMAGVLFDEAVLPKLTQLGVKDSKLVPPEKRAALYEKIISLSSAHKLVIIPPSEIDAAVESINLNNLEANTCASIINQLGGSRVIVDCPSPNIAAYRSLILSMLSNKDIDAVVEHKADANHVACSAASILAKVTRDGEVEKLHRKIGDFGSGYLSDPKTIAFFNEHFGKFPGAFRKSWAPYREKVASRMQKKLGEF